MYQVSSTFINATGQVERLQYQIEKRKQITKYLHRHYKNNTKNENNQADLFAFSVILYRHKNRGCYKLLLSL